MVEATLNVIKSLVHIVGVTLEIIAVGFKIGFTVITTGADNTVFGFAQADGFVISTL